MQLRLFLNQQRLTMLPEQVRDFETVLAFVLKMDRWRLFIEDQRQLTQEEIELFFQLWRRYLKQEPVGYLLGYSYFYNLEFIVTSDVLIPRMDSEVMIDAILSTEDADTPLRVLDAGTGSGALAITLKKHRPHWQVNAVDISYNALEVAKSNAKKHTVDIQFYCEDMIKHLEKHVYDLIVSNPPYIAEDDEAVTVSVRTYEPTIALFARENGLYYYRHLLALLSIKPVVLYVEVGYQQADTVKTMAPLFFEKSYRDFAQFERVLRFDSRKPIER